MGELGSDILSPKEYALSVMNISLELFWDSVTPRPTELWPAFVGSVERGFRAFTGGSI